VIGIELHPTKDFTATGSLDGSWAFYDINTTKCLAHVTHPESKSGITAIRFHPDGAILGAGTEDNLFRIWDVRTQQNAVRFDEHTSKLVDIAFSENGFFASSVSEDGVVKLWDLRKLKSYNSITLPHAPSALSYDYSGTYFAVSGADVRVFLTKNAELVKTYESGGNGQVTDVKFGRDAAFFATTSLDRTLKFYGEKH
jgi:pre-mRNA-processing factor 19